jgi:hypothetical protein
VVAVGTVLLTAIMRIDFDMYELRDKIPPMPGIAIFVLDLKCAFYGALASVDVK